MKKIISILFLLVSLQGFSQSKDFDYEKFSNPDTKNNLSLYFKKEVPKKLLRKIKFQPKKKNVVLSFYINKENKPYKISVSAFGSLESKKSIIEAFEKYPLEKLNLESLNKSNSYSLQIITRKGIRNIFNCSSKVIIETPPICKPCEDLEFFEDIKTCLNIEVKKHFYKIADFNLLNNFANKQKSKTTNEKDVELLFNKEVELFIQFSVSKDGKLINKKTKVPSTFKGEVLKVLESFPLIERPGLFNGVNNSSTHCFNINFREGKKTAFKEKYSNILNYMAPNSSNDFSLFYLDKLNPKFTQEANLNRINKMLTIYFEIDKENKPFNIRTSARSNTLEKEIISIFKEYPIEKLNILSQSPFNSYSSQILFFENNEILVKTSTNIGYQTVPIFPGCQNSKSVVDAKKCFSKGVQMHFSKRFDADLPNRLGLAKGRKRVFIGFKIGSDGITKNIKVKAPHPAIKNEVLNVMRTLPKIKPGIQSDKPITTKYSIPFTLIVD